MSIEEMFSPRRNAPFFSRPPFFAVSLCALLLFQTISFLKMVGPNTQTKMSFK